MSDDQAYEVKRTVLQKKLMRLSRWLNRKLYRPVAWLYFHTSLRSDIHKTEFMMGLHEAVWTYLCGYGFRFSLHIGNIYWRVER